MKRERITRQEIEAVKRVYHNGDIPARILAYEIGVSENAFYRWLSGSRTPGYLVTANIRRFLAAHTLKTSTGPAKASRKCLSEPFATCKGTSAGGAGK
jgi:hypothetical protein